MALPIKKLSEQFTYQDYLEWPEEERWELIEGTPYDMSPAPSVMHQRIVGALHLYFGAYLKGKECEIFLAPFDVRFSEMDKKDDETINVIQPDLTVVCDKKKLDKRGCKGLPDLLIEVISPGSAKKDVKIKFELYQKMGVKEYWLVHPYENSIEIFKLDNNGKYQVPERYAGGDIIEVASFPGLNIDLKDIFPAEEE